PRQGQQRARHARDRQVVHAGCGGRGLAQAGDRAAQPVGARLSPRAETGAHYRRPRRERRDCRCPCCGSDSISQVRPGVLGVATYAIGDVQGCLCALRRLLDAFAFDRARDRLWFVGDLVNRGPDSLATLRLVKDLGEAAVTVLGNHDFHLLAVAAGHARKHHSDTLDAVLEAPDREELLAWLRQQPMLHVQDEWAMVHAGLLPQWNIAQAQILAREVEAALRGENWREFLAQLYGDTPDSWSENLRGAERLRVIVNAMARMRFCTAKGTIEFRTKGETAKAPPGFFPWFDA